MSTKDIITRRICVSMSRLQKKSKSLIFHLKIQPLASAISENNWSLVVEDLLYFHFDLGLA